MAKTLKDELDELLTDPSQKLALSILLSDKNVAARLEKSNELYQLYSEGEGAGEGEAEVDEEIEEKPVAKKPVAKPAAKPAAEVKPEAKPANVASVGGGSLTEELTTLLNSKFDELKGQFIPVSKLPEYEDNIITKALKLSDDYAGIREAHREEFGERLNRDEFEAYVKEHKGQFKTMSEAHDSYVGKKRTAIEIEKGIKAGIKQRTSGTELPGQTPSSAVSPRRSVIKGEKTADAAASTLMTRDRAVAKLREISNARENVSEGAA